MRRSAKEFAVPESAFAAALLLAVQDLDSFRMELETEIESLVQRAASQPSEQTLALPAAEGGCC